MAFLDFGIVAIIKPQDQAFAWQERCASHSFPTNTPGSERHQATSQTYVLSTQPKLVLLEHFPVSGSKLSWQNAQMFHSRGGSWLVPGQDHQDWQPDLLLHPRAHRRTDITLLWHERFSSMTAKEFIGADSVPCAKSFGGGEMAERQWGRRILLHREQGKEGGDAANQSSGYHRSHLLGNRKNNLPLMQQSSMSWAVWVWDLACLGHLATMPWPQRGPWASYCSPQSPACSRESTSSAEQLWLQRSSGLLMSP